MAYLAGVPRFPEPPKEWSPRFMQEVVRMLSNWMRSISTLTYADVAASAIRTVTTSTSVGLADGCILVDTTGGNITITLPDPATVLGREFTVKRLTAGANTLTVAGAAGNTEGGASASMAAQYLYYTFKSDGTDYWIV